MNRRGFLGVLSAGLASTLLPGPAARAQVGEIRIYKAGLDGKEQGFVNVWTLGSGPKVDGVGLLFKQSSGNWDACSRKNEGFGSTDSIGISLGYGYRYVTPLGNLLGLAGNPVLPMNDRTVMALNPS